jgi:hypothetical protein
MSVRYSGIGMTSQRTRMRMVERLRAQGIRDELVLSAMGEVPRHLFIDEALAHRAYEDISLTDANAKLEGVGAGVWNVSVVAAMQEIASAIRDKRPLREGATFLDGWRNQIVLDCVRRSSADRRWVDVPA